MAEPQILGGASGKLFRCADPYTRPNPYCERPADVLADDQMLRRSNSLSVLVAVAASTPSGTIWDPFPLLCPGKICRGYNNGKPLYFDTDHLTGYANSLLLPSFMKFIQEKPSATQTSAAAAAADRNLPGEIY